MNKRMLVERLKERLGEKTPAALEAIVESVLIEIRAALAKGEQVRLPELGSFHVPIMRGIVPKTREVLRIPGVNKITFKLSKDATTKQEDTHVPQK
jgi:nucleoid DNA-binding protein